MYQISGVVMLLVSPLLTMRLITEERRLGTIKLLISSPISITELVLGKYVGITLFYCLMLFMISLMPASLMFGTATRSGTNRIGSHRCVVINVCVCIHWFIYFIINKLTGYCCYKYLWCFVFILDNKHRRH